MWCQAIRVYINQLSKHVFLGHLSSMQINLLVLENSFLMDNAMKKIDMLVPINPLIESLATMKICNTIGQPLGKFTWDDLLDYDIIINQFVYKCRNLFHYYTGSSKNKKTKKGFESSKICTLTFLC